MANTRLHRSLAVTVAVILTAATVGLYAVRPASSSSITVTVDGRQVEVRASAATVENALRAAHLVPHDGALVAAASHRVLDAHAFPAVVLLGGQAVAPQARLAPGDALNVVEGRDEAEAVQRKRALVAPTGLPDVERELWHPGRPGMTEGEMGEVSGEAVGPLQVLAAPMPAAPDTAKVVALTFDDGPNPSWTPAILQILADEQVKATFCTVGYAIGWDHGALAKTESDQGHTACDHTAHHVLNLASKHHDQIEQEVHEGADDVRRAVGADPAYYRAPGGSLSPEVVQVAHDRGLRVLGWSVDPNDYRRPPVAELVRRVLDRVRPGSVVLLHDGGGDRSNTVAALRPIIDALKAQGYAFTTPALEPAVGQ